MADQTVEIEFLGTFGSLPEAASAAQDAINDVASAAENTGEALGSMGKQAGGSATSTARLASAVGLVSPAAGKALRGISALQRGYKGADAAAKSLGTSTAALGVALAVIAVVVASAFVAYKVYNEENERAQRITDNAAAAESARQPIVDALADSVIALALATGELTEEQARLQVVSEQALSRLQASLSASTEKMAELREEQAGVFAQMVDGAESIIPAWTPLGIVVDGLTTSTSEFQEEIDALNAEITTNITLTKEQVTAGRAAITTENERREAAKEASKQSQQAAKSEASAKREEAAATKEANEAAREAQKLASARQAEASAIVDNLQQQIASTMALIAVVDQLDETERERISRESGDLDDLLQKQIAANREAGVSTAALEESRRELRAQTKTEFEALLDAEVDASREADAAIEQSAKDTAQEIVDAFVSIGNQIGDVANEIGSRFEETLAQTRSEIEDLEDLLEALSDTGVDAASLTGEALVAAFESGKVAAADLSEAQKAFLETTLEAELAFLEGKESAEREAALVGFGIAQAVAVSNAIMATAVGVMTSFALPPPGGAIMAGIVGALGAVQVGLIASESPQIAHDGFLMPDERSITARVGEAILSGQGRRALGDDVINDANRSGRAPSSGSSNRGVIVYKNKAFDYFIADHLLMDGALTRTIRRGDRVGQRRRGRG